MKSNVVDFTNELIKSNIKPSHQRIKILEYVAHNACHPTVLQIFNDLKEELPTLSKATVYNTLNAFVKVRLIREITIEDKEIRYEYNMYNHGHFKCEICGLICDFNINIDNFQSSELSEFEILDKNVYFKGICKKCLECQNSMRQEMKENNNAINSLR